MKIQIIDTKYIFNHKLFNLWKVPAITYGSLLIYSTIDGLDKIEDYEYIIEIISKCLIYSGFILVFVNMFTFSRIGLLTIDDKEITIEKYNGYDQSFSLSTIKSVEILGCGRKQCTIIINDIKLEIILELNDIEDIEDHFTKRGIEVKNRCLKNPLKKWLKLSI